MTFVGCVDELRQAVKLKFKSLKACGFNEFIIQVKSEHQEREFIDDKSDYDIPDRSVL